MFIPTKLAPAVSNPKWLNKIIKQKAKCKNKLWQRESATEESVAVFYYYYYYYYYYLLGL
jgi:hypothetical protein